MVEVGRLSGAPRRKAIRAAGRACDQALRGNPAWLLEAHRLHGTLAWLSGDNTSAGRRWQRSLETLLTTQRPLKPGFRFSTNARADSWKSSLRWLNIL